MSDWKGLHNPERHDSDYGGELAFCYTAIDGCGEYCWHEKPCRCCLAAEVERLRVTVERVREVCGDELDEGGFGYGRDERRVGWNNLRADILDALDGDR